MIFTSVANERIKSIKKLEQKKYRDLTNQFIIEGEHLVLEAYRAGYLKELIITNEKKIDLKIDKLVVSDNVLKHLTTMKSVPDMLGVCHKKKVSKIGKKVLMLDNIQDPGNLGTIIRSAAAFNVDTVIISDNSVDLYNQKVIRSTQGMIFNIDIIISNLFDIIKELKKQEYQIIGTRLNNSKELKDLEVKEKVCIIMGNEGGGISQEIMNECNSFVSIKMNDKVESLNVGVATSIILYELDK